MFKPTDSVVAELAGLISRLAAVDCSVAAAHERRVEAELARKRPDLTRLLIDVIRSAQFHGLRPGEILTAATTRAACTLLARSHPGATIEVRVPPFAAVQIGFNHGPRHTRGTPPNVVELGADLFLELVTGAKDWAVAVPGIRVSGAQAADAARAFPL